MLDLQLNFLRIIMRLRRIEFYPYCSGTMVYGQKIIIWWGLSHGTEGLD